MQKHVVVLRSVVGRAAEKCFFYAMFLKFVFNTHSFDDGKDMFVNLEGSTTQLTHKVLCAHFVRTSNAIN